MARQLRGRFAFQLHQHNELAWQAWHIVAWQRSKKMPPLQRVIKRERRKPQSWQDMRAWAKQWTEQLGGNVENLSK